MCKMKCDLSEMDLKIIAVSNRKLCERPFLEQIERVCQMKPQAIILREKDLSEEEYRILSEEVLSVCKKYEIPCILHKFWKTALELECTSVHLPLPELRKLPEGVKEQFQRIGTSVHSVEDAKEAERLGVSYMRTYLCYRLQERPGTERAWILKRCLQYCECSGICDWWNQV